MTDTPAAEAADLILKSGVVYTRASGDPFFFSSGWASPVFVDIKRLISLPAARARLVELSLNVIDDEIGRQSYEQIAGCELAGVPFAAMIADRKDLPLVVAMKQGKGFGRLARFEGTFEPGTRTLLMDDVTTDGRTKVSVQRALEDAEADVVGIYVVLDYKVFPGAPKISSLVTLSEIIGAAARGNHLAPSILKELEGFADNAAQWSRRNGGIAEIS